MFYIIYFRRKGEVHTDALLILATAAALCGFVISITRLAIVSCPLFFFSLRGLVVREGAQIRAQGQPR